MKLAASDKILDQHIHSSTADHALVLRHVVAHIHGDAARFPGADQTVGIHHHRALAAAAADGTHGAVVLVHRHHRAGADRRGAAGAIDRQQHLGCGVVRQTIQQGKVDIVPAQNIAAGTPVVVLPTAGNQLRRDGNADLLHRLRADVQPDGRVNFV